MEPLIPMVIFTTLFAMIYGLRYLKNKENMAMIQNGMDPKINPATPQPYKNLKWGLLLMGAGLGLFLAHVLDHTLLNFENGFGRRNENPAIYFSLVGIFGGLGLFISYLIEKKALK